MHFIAFMVPVWETRVRIFIGDGSEDAHLKVQKWINTNLEYKMEEFTNLDDLIAERCQGMAFQLKINDTERRQMKHCIYLKGFNGSAHAFSILNHEMYHLVNQALSYAGVIGSDEAEEAFTYMYDYITELLYTELVHLGLCNKFRDDKHGFKVISTVKQKPKNKG